MDENLANLESFPTSGTFDKGSLAFDAWSCYSYAG